MMYVSVVNINVRYTLITFSVKRENARSKHRQATQWPLSGLLNDNQSSFSSPYGK